ncbi:MAG: polyprenyl synthetase family protein [Candidatus Methanomethylophilaceae archaeon]|nr:polyprenyl synthetase family protein [Candidatus Methanomethylophilaceae archaeon]
MAEPWHSCIDNELASCERLMEEYLSFENAELTEMCRYVVMSGGKRLRPSFCILSYLACGGEKPDVSISIGSAFEIIHSATLIHDDINDQGEIRRGRKTLHKQYSLTKAIVAGDCMFTVGFRLLSGVPPQVVEYIAEASGAMGAGEFIQKDNEHASNVTEEDYMEIISGKTAKLFKACAMSGAFVAGGNDDAVSALGEFAYEVGLAFQIVDDVLDVTGDPKNMGKAVGTDLLEGKPTLPLIYAMQDPKYGGEIKALFEEPEISREHVSRALDLISMTDSVHRCFRKAEKVVENALSILDHLEDSVYKRSLIDLATYVVSRDR